MRSKCSPTDPRSNPGWSPPQWAVREAEMLWRSLLCPCYVRTGLAATESGSSVLLLR